MAGDSDEVPINKDLCAAEENLLHNGNLDIQDYDILNLIQLTKSQLINCCCIIVL